MQDSIELSSEREDELPDMNEIVSPKNRKLTKSKNITGSQESLAYSNSTMTKGNRTDRTNRELERERSPPSIFSDLKNQQNLNLASKGRPFDKKFSTAILYLGKTQQKQDYIKEQQNIEMPNFTSEQNSPIKTFPSATSNQTVSQIRSRIKTQNQADQKKRYDQLRHKNKQLQYALQVQMINSQQLRTKVQVLNELLQSNLKKNGLNLWFFKNSSKNHSHIDLYVELQRSQKSKKQFQIQNERLIQDLDQVKKQLQRYKEKGKRQIKTQTSYISNMNQSYINPSDLKQQISRLQQQKQGLFSFIQEQTKLIQEKDQHIQVIQSELTLNNDKQSRFTSIQRPKLLKQIQELRKTCQNLQQEMQQKIMEQNLTQIKYQQIINSLKSIHIRQIQQKQILIERLKTQSQRYITESDQKHFNNYKMCEDQEVSTEYFPFDQMKTELSLLKKERDYFLKEYQNQVKLNKELYGLRLKMKQMEVSLQEYQKRENQEVSYQAY